MKPLPLVLTALVAASLSNCSDPSDSRARSAPKLVLLVVIDALRADHLGCYGYSKPTSPNLDRFAANATRFANAYSTASWTKPAMPAMLTGLPPSCHRVLEGSTTLADGKVVTDVLDPEAETLAETLDRAGYATGAFLRNAQLAPATGLTQGFDTYEEGIGDAEAIHRRFLAWFDERRRDDAAAPIFAWLHVLDVHWPYLPPADAAAHFPPPPGHRDLSVDAQRRLRDEVNDGVTALADSDRAAIEALYDGCIRGYDSRFAELVDALQERGAWNDAMVIVTSDHGEEFGEAGKLGHGHSLSEALLRVPLIVKQPGQTGGNVATELVSHLDLFPTLVEFTGARPTKRLPGVPLFAERRDASVIAENLHGPTFERMLRTDDWRLDETFSFRGLPASSDVETTGDPFAAIRPGLRVDVKGEIENDGEIDVEQITCESGVDDDVEIRGALTGLDAREGRLSIGPFTVSFDPKGTVKVRGGAATDLSALQVGDVVDVDGEATAPFQIGADSLELRPDKKGSDTFKLEAMIDKVDVDDRELVVGRVRIEVPTDAKLVGFDGAIRVVQSRVPRDLLTNRALDDANLFTRTTHLRRVGAGADPVADGSAVESQARDGLSRRLRELLERCSALRSDESTLDAATLEQLRATGYLR